MFCCCASHSTHKMPQKQFQLFKPVPHAINSPHSPDRTFFFFIILCLRSKITMSFLRNEKYFQFTEMKNRQTDKNKEGHVTACCFYLIFRRDMLSTIVLQQLHHVVQKAPCPKSHRETCHQINSIQFNDVNCKNVIFVM